MNELLQNIMDQFSRGKATQGLICVGDLNQILSAFQEVSQANIVLFDSSPDKILEFMLAEYDQSLPQDKNSLNSTVLIQQGNSDNKNIHKSFFKAFKTNKTDSFKIIVISGLDDQIELFPDLFIVLNNVIKDLNKKKIRIFLALQFKKEDSYLKIQQAFDKVEMMHFEDIFNSKIVQSTKKQAPQTIGQDSDEIPKEQVAGLSEFKTKVLKAKSIFEEPEISQSKNEPEKLEKSLNLFKSYILQLQAEADSEQPPNRYLINNIEGLYEIIINAQPLLLKQLLDPLNALLQSYFNSGSETIGSIMPIARIMYFFMLTGAEDKKKRYQFVKTIAEKLQLFNRIDYAVEFYSYALSISKSQEDALIVCKYFTQLAEEDTGFMVRAYYYKALASAYVAEQKDTINQLTTKTEQTYKSKPSFPVF